MWISFTDKIIVISQTRWFWSKTAFIQAICYKHEKRRAKFFQDYPNTICFNLGTVHSCFSFMLFYFSYVVQKFQVVTAMFHSTFLAFWVLLHHIAWHSALNEPLKLSNLCVHEIAKLENRLVNVRGVEHDSFRRLRFTAEERHTVAFPWAANRHLWSTGRWVRSIFTWFLFVLPPGIFTTFPVFSYTWCLYFIEL